MQLLLAVDSRELSNARRSVLVAVSQELRKPADPLPQLLPNGQGLGGHRRRRVDRRRKRDDAGRCVPQNMHMMGVGDGQSRDAPHADHAQKNTRV
jgi:hypothetical protein